MNSSNDPCKPETMPAPEIDNVVAEELHVVGGYALTQAQINTLASFPDDEPEYIPSGSCNLRRLTPEEIVEFAKNKPKENSTNNYDGDGYNDIMLFSVPLSHPIIILGGTWSRKNGLMTQENDNIDSS